MLDIYPTLLAGYAYKLYVAGVPQQYNTITVDAKISVQLITTTTIEYVEIKDLQATITLPPKLYVDSF